MFSVFKNFRAGTALLSLLTVHTYVLAQAMCSVDSSSQETAYNASASYLGCYRDPNVAILTEAKLSTIIMTPQYCVNWCGQQGFPYGGVEFGT